MSVSTEDLDLINKVKKIEKRLGVRSTTTLCHPREQSFISIAIVGKGGVLNDSGSPMFDSVEEVLGFLTGVELAIKKGDHFSNSLMDHFKSKLANE